MESAEVTTEQSEQDINALLLLTDASMEGYEWPGIDVVVAIKTKKITKKQQAINERLEVIEDMLLIAARAESLIRAEFTAPKHLPHILNRITGKTPWGFNGNRFPWLWSHLPAKASEPLDMSLKGMGYRPKGNTGWYRRPAQLSDWNNIRAKLHDPEDIFAHYGYKEFRNGSLSV